MDKVTRVSTDHNLFLRERRAEAVSNRGLSVYQSNALPLGQTGSQGAPQYDNFFYTPLFLAENSGRLTWIRRTQQPQEQRYPFLAVCTVFSCVQKIVRFVTCSQMLMRVNEHGVCMGTVSESALKIYSGRKIRCRTGDSNLCQCSAWLFSRTLYQLSYPRPPVYYYDP